MRDKTTLVLWLVYFALLAVLLPHTAWAFGQFEPETSAFFGVRVSAVAWLAAIAFEASIAVLTHKLAQHIESVPNRKDTRRRFTERYLNAYSLGLVTAVVVSALANLAHAVEFGRPMALTNGRSWLFGVYVVVFGAVLPFVSLLFARVLSNVVEAEEAPNPDSVAANRTIGDLRSQLKAANQRFADTEAKFAAQLQAANQRTADAEARFAAAGDLMRLISADKRERILTIRQQWPELPQKSIAVMAEASPSYVSEILAEVN